MALEPYFVRTSGVQFVLKDRPFRIAGANNYYLGYESDAMVQPVLDLAVRMGLTVLRTWAFLDCGLANPGEAPANAKNGVYFQYKNSATGGPEFNDGPNGLQRLDRTIFLAEKAGVRLILPLVNYWNDFGGVNQYLEWFGVKGTDEFYRNPDIRNAYRNYVEHLLLRVNTRTGRQYRDEPAILAWELANEPRCVGGIDMLAGWASEMSSFIRSIDPHHLIGVGDEGCFDDCECLLRIPTIDFGTCHLYPNYSPEESPQAFGARWIRDHIEAGRRADKPMLIEEYGLKIDAGKTFRNEVFKTWLNQVVASGGAGALVWMIAAAGHDGAPYPDYDRYTVYAAKDVPAIVSFSQALQMPAYHE